MRLKSIKLAGFKSFVDPTTVNLPSNLCAVVGPNGCGKSNIIDAVRWVMGESSASKLRGENLTDVIFNGSSNRKPVGQASVELVFDNSDHTIKGEYAAFNEISVKRIVNSEAQSTYMLNGTKCRRRDIQDIFLGTGLGPRSYSIIEQGMVSNLIESKPEELRVFIEEAAGISKYKERRRETENRIKRTRENLERLTDIREELERQLQHLQRQARAAEKYKEYKQQERATTANLQALRWQRLNETVSSAQQKISELEIALEANVAKTRSLEADMEKMREEGTEANDTYQEIQSTYYSLGSEITRIEQNIEYQGQRKQQLELDLGEIQQSLQHFQNELGQDDQKLAQLKSSVSEVEPQLQAATAREQASASALASAESKMANWQQEWDAFNEDASETSQKAEVEQERINHLENIVDRGKQRKNALKHELENLETPDASGLQDLEENLRNLIEKQEAHESARVSLNEKIERSRQSIKTTNNELNEKRSKLQAMLGQKASLDALQKAALGRNDRSTIGWLERNNLAGKPRLGDNLQVEDKWQTAVEMVLGGSLQAVCVDSLDTVSDVLGDFSDGNLQLIDASWNGAQGQPNPQLQASRLQDKIRSTQNLSALLAGIYCAESLQEALAQRRSLNSGESLITPEGVWLGPSWLRVAKDFDEKAGVIQRQQELEALESSIATAENQIAQSAEKLRNEEALLQTLEQDRDGLLKELTEVNRSLTEVSADKSARITKIEQAEKRRERLTIEIEELEKHLAAEKDNIRQSRENLETILDRMEQHTVRREVLIESRDEYRQALDTSRDQAGKDKDEAHRLALQHQTLSAQLESLQLNMTRLTSQVESYANREKQLAEYLQQADVPIPALKEELEQKLASRHSIEGQLSQAKTRVDEIDHQKRELETARNASQEESQRIRDELSGKRLSIEGDSVKRAALEQQLTENGYDKEQVLNRIAAAEEEITELGCEEELERLGNRINRLGPINLAAIDEYDTQSERKIYLDEQNDDLERALQTLQNAIRKIDKETRSRFKETFDKINNGLQELFPKVFGGGHAYLNMVGEDLLDTGVEIMARPPGKKNSTIHLLSGGEKAMTAIALVFSIFRLNPSPFCMLDEVDAPLDDANVGRYADMVKEMSSMVQFIFITHNRITMEYAHQLLGVTMHEPGVSRLVAVDIDEAAEMVSV
ncbi:MAG: chromosome segregation protein SMC [Pseudohongiellaceae bacterium]